MTREEGLNWVRMRNEKGMTEPQIARAVGRDTRSVKRGIRMVEAAGDDRAVRVELRKEAFARHASELLKFVGEIRAAAEDTNIPQIAPTHAVYKPEGKLLRPPGMILTWSDHRVVDARLPQEGTPEWKMFRAHEKRDRVRNAFDRWKEAARSLAEREHSVAVGIVHWLEEVTGLNAQGAAALGPCASLAGANELFERALNEAAGSEDNPLSSAQEYVSADGDAVRLGPAALVMGVDDPESFANRLRSGLLDLPGRLDVEALGSAITTYREAANAVATELAYVQAAHYLAGACPACEILNR